MGIKTSALLGEVVTLPIGLIVRLLATDSEGKGLYEIVDGTEEHPESQAFAYLHRDRRFPATAETAKTF